MIQGWQTLPHHPVDDKKHEGRCSYSVTLDLLIELNTVQLFHLPSEKAGGLDDLSLKNQLAWVEARAEMMSCLDTTQAGDGCLQSSVCLGMVD